MSAKSQSHTERNKDSTPDRDSGERLQKILAAAGVASRRESEALILAGRVDVDRETVTALGTKVDPRRQEIRVDGAPIGKPGYVYYVLNKPAGVVSTNRDPDGRLRVVDLVPSDKRLFAVGRLDRSSEGMIIVTNDGELANQLTHPRYGIAKTYRAKVQGTPSAETLRKLRSGVHLAEGLARVSSLKVRSRHARGVELEIVLTEGRNREIRRILAKVGHKVQALRRTAVGPIRLGQLKSGEYRVLSHDEVRVLRRAVRRSTSDVRGRKNTSVSTRSRTVKASQTSARANKSGGMSRRKSAKGASTAGARGKQKGTSSSSGAKGGRRSGGSRTGTVTAHEQGGKQGARAAKRSRGKGKGKGKQS